MENNLVKNGFTVLNYDENLSDYLTSYDTSDFKDLHLKNTSWKCKIKKLNEGRLFDLLCKYEKTLNLKRNSDVSKYKCACFVGIEYLL